RARRRRPVPRLLPRNYRPPGQGAQVKGIPLIAWIGLGLLAISAMLLTIGTRDTESFPAADSYSPSGTAALSHLLEQNGYRVAIDRRIRPQLAPGDVAIAFALREPDTLMGTLQQASSEGEADRESELEKPFPSTLVSH